MHRRAIFAAVQWDEEGCAQWRQVRVFPVAVVTNDHEHDGFKPQKYALQIFWRLEVQSHYPRPKSRCCSLWPPCLLQVLVAAGVPWLEAASQDLILKVRSSNRSLPPRSHCVLLSCVSLFSPCSPSYRDSSDCI